MSRHTNDETPRLLRALLERIHKQHHHRKQAALIEDFKKTLPYVFLFALVIFLTQYHIQMYNIIAGPFHLNHKQLVAHLKVYQQEPSSSRSDWFSWPKQYLQIEIGENHIERDKPCAQRVYSFDQYTSMILASMYHIKEPTIGWHLSPGRFFITLVNEIRKHRRIRSPYRFEAFKIRTLRCAVRHLGFRRAEYRTWLEKSVYVRSIEKRYRENATVFNTVVAPACGMFIGYLYRPKGEITYLPESGRVYPFRTLDIGFDTHHAYHSYTVSVFVGIVFGWLLLKSLVYPIIHLVRWLRLRKFVLSSAVRARLKKLNVDSLQTLDGLLCGASEERQYQHQLFIIREQHLIVLHVDWMEHDPLVLAPFYTESPFTAFTIASITKLSHKGFRIRKRCEDTWILFPIATCHTEGNRVEWLHGQMMSLNESYREA